MKDSTHITIQVGKSEDIEINIWDSFADWLKSYRRNERIDKILNG